MPDTRRPVYFAGENPAMILYEAGSDESAAVAIYWRCYDGPSGPGAVLFLWARGASPATPQGASFSGAYTDNPGLASSLARDLLRYFQEFKGIPVADLPILPASLEQRFDGSVYEVACRSADLGIDLAWEEPLDRKQIVWSSFPSGEAAFDLSTVIRPCARASARVDGRALPGEARLGKHADGMPSSSAFLAFSETWIGPL